jgi:hypothetical protein
MVQALSPHARKADEEVKGQDITEDTVESKRKTKMQKQVHPILENEHLPTKQIISIILPNEFMFTEGGGGAVAYVRG